MTTLVHKNDAVIQRKIDRGIWRPSLDTGHIYSTEIHRNLKETTNKSGYCIVGSKDILVSRVIWIAAHGIPEAGMEVDHINGNRQDNRLENLQIITHADNSRKSHHVLTFDDAEEIRRAHAAGETQTSLAKKYGVSPYPIHCIVTGQTYKSRPPHERNAELAAAQVEALDYQVITEICAEHRNGASIRQIAKRWGITATAVRTILWEGGET